jgi:hypothetical protein
MPVPSSWFCLAFAASLVACGGDLTLPATPSGGDGSPTGPEPPSCAAVSAADDRYSTREGDDHTLSIPSPGVLGNDLVEGVPGTGLQAILLEAPEHGRLALHADGSLDYTPDADWFGSERFSYRAALGATESAPAEVVIEVQSVNDAPRFTPGPDQRAEHKADEQQVEHWAGDIAPGPANESDQQVSFVVEVLSGNDVLKGTPTISPSGTLTYRPSHHEGSATIGVRLQDDGGTANDGTDTSPIHVLTISVDE